MNSNNADFSAQTEASPQWEVLNRQVQAEEERLGPPINREIFHYQHKPSQQMRTPDRFRADYTVPTQALHWGTVGKPVLLCMGGIANCAYRFSYLASALKRDFHIISIDWVGRGGSGWLRDWQDYTLTTCIEQVKQYLEQLEAPKVHLLGSSWGGIVGMHIAACMPKQAQSLILNDIGPHLASERRIRRAETLTRHYVFRTPEELLEKTGVSQKNDGPVQPAARMLMAFRGTRWSDEEQGRVYRHDPRCMLAYQEDAKHCVDCWPIWNSLNLPIMLLHGLQSDALPTEQVQQMQKTKPIHLVELPGVGHTPSLCQPNQIEHVQRWLSERALGKGLSFA